MMFQTDVIISDLQSHLNLVLLDSWLTHLNAKTLFFPVINVIEAYRTLRDRGPYPPDQILDVH
ncbi:hypothetical protein KY284_032688 [Solanum tuberosum]|nr:hypothetical protein KY284_032688 [Solanum tuberosum]